MEIDKFDVRQHFKIEILKEDDMVCDDDAPVPALRIESVCMCVYCKTKTSNLSEIQMREHLRNCEDTPISLKNIFADAGICTLTLKERFSLMEAIKEMYSIKLYHNYTTFYETVKKLFEHKWAYMEQLKKAMTDAGFCLVNVVDSRPILMEYPAIRFARYTYLKKIIKYRQQDKHIYYIDELHIEIESDTLIMRKPTAKDLQAKFDYHPKMFFVCSVDGCTNTLFSFCLGKGDYMKWIVHSLIPSLKPRSVVVMDNSFLHGDPKEAHITRYHTKSDMIKWLEDRNIPCHTSMHKAELFELIDKCPIKHDGKLDRIFKGNGHEIVRLPCQVHQLSMCSLMLQEIKGSLKLNPKSSNPTDRQMTHLLTKLKLSEAIKAIPPAKWNEFSLTLQKYEKDFLNIDCELEDLLDMNFKMNIKDFTVDKITTCSFCNGKERYMEISAS